MTDTQRFGRPQVGGLYVSETQGRLHILVSYEFTFKCKVEFYRYYDIKLKRLDDGFVTAYSKPQHEFYKRFKPLNMETTNDR